MEPLSKAAKKQLRHVIGIAYEREMANELGKLEKHFARWRSGELGPIELDELVHRFRDGPSRKPHNQYTDGALEWLAASTPPTVEVV